MLIGVGKFCSNSWQRSYHLLHLPKATCIVLLTVKWTLSLNDRPHVVSSCNTTASHLYEVGKQIILYRLIQTGVRNLKLLTQDFSVIGESRPTAGTSIHWLGGKKVPRTKKLRNWGAMKIMQCSCWGLRAPAERNGDPKGIIAGKGHKASSRVLSGLVGELRIDFEGVL